jgi:hypothetical protein
MSRTATISVRRAETIFPYEPHDHAT